MATPFFIFWGWLSDKVGRKWIMIAGMVLGVLSYRPIYRYFYEKTDSTSLATAEVVKMTELPTFRNIDENRDSVIVIQRIKTVSSGVSFKEGRTDRVYHDPNKAGYHEGTFFIYDKTLPPDLFWKFVFLVFIQIFYVTMVYGPIAAFLVELFPTKIRYTSMSLPYHVGNGVFGGLVPFIATLISSFPGSNYLSGLWYPIGVASVCVVIGSLYLSNKIDPDVND